MIVDSPSFLSLNGGDGNSFSSMIIDSPSFQPTAAGSSVPITELGESGTDQQRAKRPPVVMAATVTESSNIKQSQVGGNGEKKQRVSRFMAERM